MVLCHLVVKFRLLEKLGGQIVIDVEFHVLLIEIQLLLQDFLALGRVF